jgi:hypothetical protein
MKPKAFAYEKLANLPFELDYFSTIIYWSFKLSKNFYRITSHQLGFFVEFNESKESFDECENKRPSYSKHAQDQPHLLIQKF